MERVSRASISTETRWLRVVRIIVANYLDSLSLNFKKNLSVKYMSKLHNFIYIIHKSPMISHRSRTRFHNRFSMKPATES